MPPRAGGLEGVVDALARAYTDSGDDVVVVGYDDDAGPAAYRREPLRGWNGLERHGVPVPVLTLRSFARLRRTVRSADAVHVHGLAFLSSFAALLACRRGQRVVVTEHVGAIPFASGLAVAVQRVALSAGRRLAQRRNAAVTALNDRVVTQVAASAKIPNGVDLEFFSPVAPRLRAELRARRGWDSPTVLVVGRNAPKKRLDLILGAAHELRSVRFVVCGLETEKLGWSEPNVDVLGSVDHAMLADHYRAADLLVLPSEGEGQPLCVLEALASGLPVVLGADPVVLAELPDCVVPVDRSVGAVVAAIKATLPAANAREALSTACARAVAGRGWADVAAAYRALLTPAAAEA
ncbi:MAG TPA: glycosyltransferase family 4 protein [Acidimicrobiales bacterium]|nr:glycosyltransferase family 4 protein [Acidimicrobiales bacterium]